MLRYMLDTNICIYAIKRRPLEVVQHFNRHATRLCISTVTLMELFYGAEKSSRASENLTIIESFASRLEVMPFDASAAAHTAQIRHVLAKIGTPIGPFDSQIAGHARSLGLTVVTNNIREFIRVPGIQVENWVTEPGWQ